MYSATERRYLEATDLGRLATASQTGRPHVVPVCFTLLDDTLVTPIDEKPKRVSATELKRVKNIQANPQTVLLADHYTDNWDDLGWVQVRGSAAITMPDETPHKSAIAALRAKYTQYTSHILETRPVITITPDRVQSWGTLNPNPSR